MDPNTNIPANINKPMTKNTKPLGISLAVLSLILMAIFLPRWIIQPADVTVVGTGNLSVEPKSASMIVMRLNVAQDPNIAIDNGESGINALIDTVKTTVGSTADIQKTFYTVTPSTSQQTSGEIVRVYQVGNAFKATFSDVSKTNSLIKELYAKGASSITSVAFAPEDKAAIEQQARDLAFKDAKTQAEKMAKSVGKRLGRIISIGDDQAAAESTLSSTQSTDGLNKIDITKQVSVIYEIW